MYNTHRYILSERTLGVIPLNREIIDNKIIAFKGNGTMEGDVKDMIKGGDLCR
jgi:hypothetical protein